MNRTKIVTLTMILIIIFALISVLLPNHVQAANVSTKALINIDYPQENKAYKNSIYIQGWVMSKLEKKTIKAYIDSTDVSSKISLEPRDDVINAIQGYGTKKENPTPGFSGTIDILGFDSGTHTLTIKVISNNNEISKSVRQFTIKEYDSLLQVDYPTNNQISRDTLYVQGWLLSEDKEVTVQVELNGKTYTPERQQRQDVLNAINGYGGSNTNKTPGYSIDIDISNLEYKIYELKIKAISSKGTILQESIININVKMYDTLLQVDYPINNKIVKNTLLVQGWLLSEDKEATVQIELNGKTYTPERQQRQDVLNAISGYGGSSTNKTPGYKIEIDTSDLKDGTYDLKVIVYSELGVKVKEETRKITVKKYNTYLNIDYPETEKNYRNTLYIQGWDMSEQKDRKIEIYIDNDYISDEIIRVKREDVLAVIKGYGDEITNQLPGFNVTIDISKYSKGEHTITVRTISTVNNEVLADKTIKVTLNKIDFETGIYGYSGLKVAGDSRGTDLKYYKVGNGENVFFAVFGIHGFEDAFPRDGTEISIIAENFVNKLLSMQDDELADNWTIYIFPDANPDGRNYGWTNNGEGRTTLYSAAPNNKGIDLNRCWSVNFTPLYNDRNYTGPEPFLAYEARYLRDFLLSKKSVTGQTILIDLHGWTTQVIGDSELCSYYSEEFPENEYTLTYGKGYLINWARASLGNGNYEAKSALIELPEYGLNGKKISEHQDVVDSKYSDRYIEATLNMLRGIL